MANLTDSTNLIGTITLEKPTGTKIILDTDQKYLTKDIELTINTPTTTATVNGTTVSYGTGWINSGSTTITDTNLTPENIAEGVTIFGVTGTYNGVLIDETQDPNGGVITTITTGVHHIKTQGKIGIEPLTTSQTIRADSGYDALSSVQINPIPSSYIIPEGTKSIVENGETDVTEYKKVDVNVQPALQEKTIIPSSKVVTQNITPDSGYYGLSKVVVKPIPSQYIIPNGTYEITENGYTDITEYEEVYVDVQPPLQSKTITPTKSTQIITVDNDYYGLSSVTVDAIPTEYIIPTGSTTITNNGTTNVTQYASVTVNVQPTLQTKTATPSETAQEITPSTGYDGLSKVTVAAISNTYVGSNISRNDSTSLTASGATVTVPAGYYATQATKSVATTTQATPTISVGTDGVITATATQTAGYVAAGEKTAEYELNTQAAVTITPSTTEQTAVAANKYTIGAVKVAPIPSNYIVPTGTKTITENGIGIDVAQYATVDVNIDTSQPLQAKTHIQPSTSSQTISADTGYYGLSSVQIDAMPSGSAATPATSMTANPSITIDATGLITSTVSGSKSITPTIEAGYITNGTAGTITVSGSNTNQLSVEAAKTVTPIEEEQTAVTAGKYTTGAIKVAAISSTYVGSEIDRHDSTDLIASGATITVPAGYYEEQASKAVTTATHPNPSISVDTATGLITASHTQTSGYVSSGTTSDTTQLTTKAATTITPTENEQVAVAANTYTLGQIKVSAISSTYVGSDIPARDETDLTANGATVTVPAGYYADDETKSVASGSVTSPALISDTEASVSTGTNTLTLTKDISVTPNVTTAGYIESGTAGMSTIKLTANVTTKAAATITPTTSAQTIAAGTYLTGKQTIAAIPSQYIVPSGNKAITANGTNIDVSQYSTVSVAVPLQAIADEVTTLPNGGTSHNIVGVDISQDTVDAAHLAQGYTAHKSDGTAITGTMPSSFLTIKTTTKTLDTSSSSIAFTNLLAAPKVFFVRTTSGTVTWSYTAPSSIQYITVAVTGKNGSGSSTISYATSGTYIQRNTSIMSLAYFPTDTSYTAKYNNGTLTITGLAASFIANKTYELTYIY